MTHIYARVQDQVLTATIAPRLACNNRNTVQMHVEFDASWDALSGRSAVFTSSFDSTPYEVILSGGVCTVPQEVLSSEGHLFIFVRGVNSSTGAVKSTMPIMYKVLPGTPSLVVSAPSADVYQQLLTQIATMHSRLSVAESAATVDSEVQGIRAGADGKTYATAGDAVREQFGEITSVLAETTLSAKKALAANVGFYIASTGIKFENTGYSISEPLEISAGYTIKFTARGYKTQTAMVSLAQSDGTYLPVVISADSTLQTYEYEVKKSGRYVFSWANADAYELKLYGDIEAVSLATAKKASREADYVSLSLFSKFGVVGDSYASGEMYFNDKNNDIYDVSWGQIMARKLGTKCVNFSAGGLSTKGFLTNSKGLPLLLSKEAQDIYYLALGINDANNYGAEYLGTISDISSDYTRNADSFYGNYGRIISSIQEHAPNAKMVMFTVVPTTTMKATYNEAIINIANHFGIPYIVQTDDEFFTSEFYANGKVQAHPVAIVYSGMANAFERLLKKCILSNYEYFRDCYMA